MTKNKTETYHLPLEILSHTLECAGLVAPFDLEWSPDRGLVPFDCCRKCTATLDCCACSYYHGAHSRSCTCWRLPLSIFLVSRQVYGIAKMILYQQNRFIILPEGGRLDDLGSCRVTFPALINFLKWLPPNTTPLLRSISIPEPVLGGAYTQLLTEWRNVIRILITTCDTRKLSLALFMGHTYEIGRGPVPEAILRSSYQTLTEPFWELRNFKDLFIYIQWPNYSTADDAVWCSSELEKEVLGSGYNSMARGKWVHLPRLWYNGMSREGPVFAPNGHQIWPRPFGEDAYGPPAPPPYIYV